MRVTRRRMLTMLGWSAVGITAVAGGCAIIDPIPALPHRGAPRPDEAALWLSLRPDGLVHLVSPRSEMGQGIASSLAMLAAEELGLGADLVVPHSPRTDQVPAARATVGSDSIKEYGPLVAAAAAALRQAILKAGAQRLGAAVGDVVLSDQGVSAGSRSVSLTDLGGGAPVLAESEAVAGAGPVSLTPGGPRRVIGTGRPTADIRAIVTGEQPVYAADVRLPGMAYGGIVRLPRYGARIVSFDDSKARAVRGVIGVYRDGDRLGIVAERRGALAAAIAAMTAQWEGGDAATEDGIRAAVDVDVALRDGSLDHVDFDDDVGGAAWDVDLRLDVPMAAHAAIEPRTAVARWSDGLKALEVWTGSQDVFFNAKYLAKAFGLSSSAVTVIGMRVGGGFGSKTICAAEMEAAWLARQTGRPVMVQWSREDEFRAGFHRPPSSHRVRARLGPDGRLDAIWHAFRSGHVIFTSAAMGPTLQFATSFVADPGVQRGGTPPYPARARRVEFDDVRLPIMTGPWRGLGAAANVWAIETAMDALARKAGRDPLELRLAALGETEPRLGRVLKEVARMSGWAARPSSVDSGFGIACGIYKEMSYAAVVAQVRLNNGAPIVERMWCAHDCGLVINPDQVRAQIEGNLVWGLGMALFEELKVQDGQVTAASFGDIRLPLFSDVPEMTIELIDGGEPPMGAGETAIVASTAAVTNAVAALTGATVTQLPYAARSV